MIHRYLIQMIALLEYIDISHHMLSWLHAFQGIILRIIGEEERIAIGNFRSKMCSSLIINQKYLTKIICRSNTNNKSQVEF